MPSAQMPTMIVRHTIARNRNRSRVMAIQRNTEFQLLDIALLAIEMKPFEIPVLSAGGDAGVRKCN